MADCGAWVTVFPCPLTQSACLRSPQPRLRNSSPRRTLVPRLFWGTYVKRTFISAAAILAFAATAHADELSDIQAQAKQLRDQNATMTKRLADLEKRQKALETQKPVLINPVDAMAADLPYKAAVKARPPENDDICIKGICVYGNFDMGLTYIQHSAPFAGSTAGPLDVLVSKNGGQGAYFGAGANQLSTSFIGLRGKQEIGDNLYAVFNLQTLFNPASGMNANGTATIAQNNGLNIGFQNSFGDSSKGGQMFNNAAYFGISSPTYGTFTMGRQSALTSDLVVNYDPLSGSNSWSVITFQGANGGGGDTENRIYDNSYEYRVNVGPVRFAAEVQARNGGNSTTGNAFEGNVGFDYMGFSMDFVGGKIFDAVSSAPLGVNGVPTVINGVGATGVATNVAIGNGQLAGTISDDTVFSVGARYTIGPWKLFGGYEHINYANPNNPINPGAFAQGGFIIAAPNNAAFPSDKILQTAWFGVRYAITPALDITGAYYHEWDNTYATSAATLASCAAQGNAFSATCAGTLDAASVVVDWRFARHVDVYAGVMYSQVTGGLANGFVNTTVTNTGAPLNPIGNRSSNFDPGIGLRYQF
jgi:predicted porin